MTRIFISHSHSDEAIAYKLVTFLLAALRLEEEEILCPSNPDQGLSYSPSSITDQLKNQLKNSEALIVLITADSLDSAWIPFEAGSFWTTDKPIIPILGPGLGQNDLLGPLRSFLSISIESSDFENKLNNAINQLVSTLKIGQRVTKRRTETFQDFSKKLKAWKSQLPQPDTSQQEQIERLNKQLEELQQQKQNLEQSLQSQISQLQQQLEEKENRINQFGTTENNYQQEKQRLEQSFQARIEQIEQQLEQEKSQSKSAQNKLTEKESENAQLLERISRLQEQLQSSSKAITTKAIELKSEKGVDYTKLQELLAAGEWKKADQETTDRMIQAAGRQEQGWLDTDDIDKFPCEDLRTINQLWLHYSKGKFGFSVQKEIYESLRGTRQYNEEVWKNFCDQVGWRKGEKWLYYSDLIFDVELAPSAHLPVLWGGRELGGGLCSSVGVLFSRAKTCDL